MPPNLDLDSSVLSSFDQTLALSSSVAAMVADSVGLVSDMFVKSVFESESGSLQPSSGTLSIGVGDTFIDPQHHRTLVVRSITLGSVILSTTNDLTDTVELTPQRVRVMIMQKNLLRR